MANKVEIYNQEYANRPNTVIYYYDLIEIDPDILIFFWRLLSLEVSRGSAIPILTPILFIDKKQKNLYNLTKMIGQVPPSTILFLVTNHKYGPDQLYWSFVKKIKTPPLSSLAILIGKKLNFSNSVKISGETDKIQTIEFLEKYGKLYLNFLEENASSDDLIVLSSKKTKLISLENEIRRRGIDDLAKEALKRLSR